METYEPFLMQEGLLQRTPRGRMATRRAYQHMNIEPPVAVETQQQSFFEKP